MSIATLEREILKAAKTALNNQRLSMNDIMEWSTGEIKEVKGEVRVRLENPGVWVAVKEKHDNREQCAGGES